MWQLSDHLLASQLLMLTYALIVQLEFLLYIIAYTMLFL